ncbi:glycosyltransferase [Aeromonas jandaei]|uniref:Glycosyltransferase n=1 Tax=Aeromonas jandaei TaxID=650 RepID=A0ABD7EM61_AERJA|nr:glycosyltransferase [Aeromonas jandaei]QWL62247.1 glycosyltransferase [Aeromonas jandaei]
MKRKSIVISATSLIGGGGLTILNQLIEHSDSQNDYHLFINDEIKGVSEKANFHVTHVKRQSALKRIIWDFKGLRATLKAKGIDPDVVVSLQNTTVYFPGKPKIVYLHQGIPLNDMKWSFFSKRERGLAFYKYIYPLFIFLYNDKLTYFVVQTKWMKEALVNKFSLRDEATYVLKPAVNLSVEEYKGGTDTRIRHRVSLFYPATPEPFKDHEVVLRALSEIGERDDISQIGLYFTIAKGESRYLDSLIDTLGLSSNVVYLGKLSFPDVQRFYRKTSATVFPSKIESFGLPLLEAASKGQPIICADTSFSREILNGYEGATFVSDSALLWSEAIQKLSKSDLTPFNNFEPKFDSGWNDFFKLLNKICEV